MTEPPAPLTHCSSNLSLFPTFLCLSLSLHPFLSFSLPPLAPLVANWLCNRRHLSCLAGAQRLEITLFKGIKMPHSKTCPSHRHGTVDFIDTYLPFSKTRDCPLCVDQHPREVTRLIPKWIAGQATFASAKISRAEKDILFARISVQLQAAGE